MQVFLTGGTGFIGQAVVRAMRQRGWDVRALVRNLQGESSRWMAAKGCSLVAGDVTRREGLREAMAGADVVLHAAGVYEFGVNSTLGQRMQQVNVQGTDNVLNAALEAKAPRTVYVSTVAALGPSGLPPEPAVPKDETQRHSDIYFTAYERSKAEAHQVALTYRTKGLPVVIAIPNSVVGANDHATIGYYLRLYLLGAMPPVLFGCDSVISFVDVDALADGLCLVAEKAPIGEDYLFCGEPISLRELFRCFGRYPGGMAPRLCVPRWLMRPQMALMEPLLRALGVPGFLSRDAVDSTKGHFNYTSAKARRDLGWTHPGIEQMWEKIVRRERELISGRQGFLNRLRHQAVVPD